MFRDRHRNVQSPAPRRPPPHRPFPSPLIIVARCSSLFKISKSSRESTPFPSAPRLRAVSQPQCLPQQVLYCPRRYALLRATWLWMAHWALLGVALLTCRLQSRAVRLLFLVAVSGYGTLGCRSISGLSTLVNACLVFEPRGQTLGVSVPARATAIPSWSLLPPGVSCSSPSSRIRVLTRLRMFSLVFPRSHLDALPLRALHGMFFYALSAPRILRVRVLVLCFFGPCMSSSLHVQYQLSWQYIYLLP